MQKKRKEIEGQSRRYNLQMRGIPERTDRKNEGDNTLKKLFWKTQN